MVIHTAPTVIRSLRARDYLHKGDSLAACANTEKCGVELAHTALNYWLALLAANRYQSGASTHEGECNAAQK